MFINVSQSLRRRPKIFFFFFFPGIKDIQFGVIEEEHNQKILAFEKQESDHFDFYPLKNTLTD